MFKKGKVTGNIRGIYSVFSNDVHYLTGEGDKHNPDLSSSQGANHQLSEAYVNYKNKGLNLRVGRQIIDTPLVDSDDIRMTPNTFDAYSVVYERDKFSFIAAHVNAWQGYDAGLENGWVNTGKDGVNFGGLSYSNAAVDVSAWYYNISNASASDIIKGADQNGNNSFYADISGHFDVSDELFVHVNLQYLKQNELDGSNVKANIYGSMAQVVYGDFSVGLAYNKSIKQKGKHSFSGYGGGTLYTSMDTMILDEITEDRDAQAIVISLRYTLYDVNFLYAYGNFDGKANSLKVKEHIVAQNIGLEYTTQNELTLAVVYVIHDNKEDSKSTFYNDNNFRILASYNF
ncbi:OprD family outer membrane porin [Sulfurimonas sp.]|uniref:OprD family outer membrane porin n=1 Tax=Sulfurimonas sp. TaxID=2022749 RepID=UPI002604CC0B|nr:OprD family outer membrane porin [Sulfurimonas sp.]